MDKNLEAAKFWLVFGEGLTIEQSLNRLEQASASAIDEWSKLAHQSWKCFEQILHGDYDLLESVKYKPSLFSRIKYAASQLFFSWFVKTS